MATKTDAPEKRGGILGFFDSIKDFFKNLFEKIRMAIEFNKRVEDGKKYWDSSPEGQQQRENLEKEKIFGPYKSRAQHEYDQQVFPGYDQMKVTENGLIRIPPHTEKLWKSESPTLDATRYLNVMQEGFSDRPNPEETGNSSAFSELAYDMRKALENGDTSLHQFIIGKTHITACVKDDKIQLSISDGYTAKSFTCNNHNDVTQTLMTAYTQMVSPRQPVCYVNQHTETKSLCCPPQPGRPQYDTFTAHSVSNWKQNGENREKYSIPNAMEISGSTYISTEIAKCMVGDNVLPNDIDRYDLEAVMKRAYNQAKNTGHSSMFIVGDKILWATAQEAPHHDQAIDGEQKDATITFNVTSYTTQHPVHPISINTSEPYKLQTDEGKTKKAWMINKTGRPNFNTMAQVMQSVFPTIDSRAAVSQYKAVVDLAKGLHPTSHDLANIAQSCADGIGKDQINGYSAQVADLRTDNHELGMYGYERLQEDGSICYDTEVEFDGKCLYLLDTREGYDGTVLIESKGMFETLEEALQYVAEQTAGETWTRNYLDMPATMLVELPQQFREQLPQEYQDALNEYEELSQYDELTPDFLEDAHDAK